MSDELPEVTCAACDFRFTVIWQNDATTEGPTYCPRCGKFILQNYISAAVAQDLDEYDDE